MGCNRDNNCLKIAKDTYPSLQSDIDNSVSNINNQIDATIESLSNLYIPDDYLGNKVKDKIKEICDELTTDEENVKSFSSNVNNHIKQKISEHQTHYDRWKEKEQKRLEEKKENK